MHALHGNGSTEAFVAQLELADVPALVTALQKKFGNCPGLRHALQGNKSMVDYCVAGLSFKTDFPKVIDGLAEKHNSTMKWSARGAVAENSNTRALASTCKNFLKMMSGQDEAALLTDVVSESVFKQLAPSYKIELDQLLQNLKEKFQELTAVSVHHPGRKWILKAIQGCVPP